MRNPFLGSAGLFSGAEKLLSELSRKPSSLENPDYICTEIKSSIEPKLVQAPVPPR
jgi:hypothetical protein